MMNKKYTYLLKDHPEDENPEMVENQLSYEQDYMMQFTLGEDLYRDFFKLLEKPDAKLFCMPGTDQIAIVRVSEEGDVLEDLAWYVDYVYKYKEVMDRREVYEYFPGLLEKAQQYISVGDPLGALEAISEWVRKVKPMVPEEYKEDFQATAEGIGLSRRYYQDIPHTLARNPDLDPHEFRILCIIRSYCWTSSNWYTRSVEKLAKDGGMGIKTARRRLDSLVEKGYLLKQVQTDRYKSGKQKPHWYKPVDSKLYEGIEEFKPKTPER